MSNETIMLAKKFDITKVSYPAYITEKLDGVAVKIIGDKNKRPYAITRQGELVNSISHILNEIGTVLEQGFVIVGELYIEGKDFKDISGLVRRNSYDNSTAQLNLYVYDMYYAPCSIANYALRRHKARKFTSVLNSNIVNWIGYPNEYIALDSRQLQYGIDALLPNAKEGLVIRSANELYREGKRSWGMQKLKKVNTVDLEVVGFIEAEDELGIKKKGMLGAFEVLYENVGIIKVGAGKLNHKDRVKVWLDRKLYLNKIIEVSYMPDDSYDKLRQPIFERFRDDKIQESYE